MPRPRLLLHRPRSAQTARSGRRVGRNEHGGEVRRGPAALRARAALAVDPEPRRPPAHAGRGAARLRRHLRVHQAHRAAGAQGQGGRRGDERHPQRHLLRRCSTRPGPRVPTWSSGAATPCCCSSGAPTMPLRAGSRRLPDAGHAAHVGRLATTVGLGHPADVGRDPQRRVRLLPGRRPATCTASCWSAAPAPRTTAVMEAAASAGQIVVSPATAALLPPQPARTARCRARRLLRSPAGARRRSSSVLPAPDAGRRRRPAVLPPADPRQHLLAGDRRAGAPRRRGRVRAVLRHGRAAHREGRPRLADALDECRPQRAARLRRPRRHVLRDRHRPRRRQDHARRRGAAQLRVTTRSGCCAPPASWSLDRLADGCRCGSASTAATSSPATSAPPSGVPTRSRATRSTSRRG